MRDELYINGKAIELSPSEPIGFTLQVYDIAQLEPLAAYSNRFFVPETGNNNISLNNSNTVSTNTLMPYRRLPCTFIRNGLQVIPSGIAIIEGSQGGYDITIYSSIFDFFQQLGEKTLKDIDWSEYNHDYTMPVIKNLNINFINGTSDICWPLIQWGAYRKKKAVDIRYQQPIISFPVVVEKIFGLTTYTKSGEIFGSGIYNDMGLTLSPDEYEASEEVLLARSFKATIAQNITDVGIQADGDEARPPIFNLISYFSNVTAPGYTSVDCIYRDINPSHYFRIPSPASWAPTKILSNTSYRSLTYTTVRVKTRLTIKNKTLYDNDFEYYSIFKNNIAIYRQAFVAFTGEHPSTNVFNSEYTVDLKPGDEIKIQIRLGTLTEGSQHGFVINDQDLIKNFMTIEAIDTMPYGGPIDYNYMVPELQLKDILKSFCQQFALIITPNDKEISFTQFKEIKGRISESEDWSNKLDLTLTPSISYRIGSYAQNNKLKYKNDQYTNGFGDSQFQINDTVLPVNVDLFELIYPSCLPEANIRTTDYKFFQLPIERYYDLPQWVNGTAYAVDDEVAFNNLIYKCIITITGGINTPLDSGFWGISSDQYQTTQPNQGVKIDRYTLINADDWSPSETYTEGDEVKEGNRIYVSKQDNNTNRDPESSPSYWELREIQYEQSITSDSRLVLLRAISPVNPLNLFAQNIKYTDGVTTLTTTTDKYPMAYFSDNSQLYTLMFQYLIENNWQEFIQMLNQLKVLTALINLTELDILELDFLILKYLDYYDNHFYLIKAEEYISGQSTLCQLIRM